VSKRVISLYLRFAYRYEKYSLKKFEDTMVKEDTKGSDRMIFITLVRCRKKPTDELITQLGKLDEQMIKEGSKVLGMYWTLGRYDGVLIMEGKDEKAALKALMRWGDIISSETLVAVTREEAIKLLK